MNIQVFTPTKENFAAYGELIQLPSDATPTFSDDHFSYWKQQGIINTISDAEVGVLNVRQKLMSFELMERHNFTAELLVPLNGSFICPVAIPSLVVPNADQVTAFCISQGQAILLKPNCWHWMPILVEKEILVLVIFKNNTSADDLIIEKLNETCYLFK